MPSEFLLETNELGCSSGTNEPEAPLETNESGYSSGTNEPESPSETNETQLMTTKLPTKDPNAVEPYFIYWCSKDGTNANTAADTGELKGATISTSSWAIAPTGELTEDSENTSAVTIEGVSYAVNTVATIWLSAGTPGTTYQLTNTITTSDSRTLNKTIEILIKES
jgi:hypothetical protein